MNLKKYVVCVIVLLLMFLSLGQKSFSESTPSSILLGELQHFDLQSPTIIPFVPTLPPIHLPVSSSGFVLNTEAYSLKLGNVVELEQAAKSVIGLDLLNDFSAESLFLPSRAIEHLANSLVELENLRSMLQESNIMVGMTLIQTKLGECIEKDNEAIMLLEEIKDRTPSLDLLADSGFTTTVTAARRLINEAIRCKKMVQGKLERIEPRVGQNN